MNGYNLSFAGAGRVGAALCRAFYKSGYSIDMIVSRTEKSGTKLAQSCNARWSSEPVFPGSTSVIIVAVPDHELKGVLNDLKCSDNSIVVHTAGSFGLDIFPERLMRKGVIYPLQTFSPGRTVSFEDLPFFIEFSDDFTCSVLNELVASLKGKIYYADTEKRKLLHLAAVFACNFTNHLLTSGKVISEKAGFPFDILHPLINETISKALELGPEKSQTGPAFRNDRNTIDTHLELLSFSSDLSVIYKDITDSIIKYYKNNHSG